LFTPVGSNITDALFFVPGTNGAVPATVTGFGAVFTDVDQPDGSGPGKKKGNRGPVLLDEYYDATNMLAVSFPASRAPVLLRHRVCDARIARVRIKPATSPQDRMMMGRTISS
jgi:hypothetical protein